jgi:hypothetical protein
MKMKFNARKRDAKIRSKSAFGLVTVLSVALISTLLLSGLLAGIVNVYRTVASNKSKYNVQNSAEAGIDYAIAQLNRTTGGDNFNPDKGPVTPIVLTKELLALPTLLPTTVIVTNCMPPTTSTIFDPVLSKKDENGDEQNWSLIAQNEIQYKMIVSKVSSGIISDEITVIAKPTLGKRTENKSPSPYFPPDTGAIGTGSITISDNVETRGYNSTDGSQYVSSEDPQKHLGGDLTAFKQVRIIGSNIKVGGSITVPSINAPSNFSATAQSSTGFEVNRYVTVSQNLSEGSFTSNVLGLSANPLFPSNGGPAVVDNSTSIGQTALAPPPAAPSMNSVPIATGSDLVIGDNVVQSANIANTNVSGETRVFVENPLSTGSVLNIDGNVNTNSKPSNLQFWYNGKGVINVTANDVRATIYAPNATVNVTGKTTGATFRGNIVAKDLNLKDILLYLDKTTTQQGAAGTESLQYNSDILSNIEYKAVSYRRK